MSEIVFLTVPKNYFNLTSSIRYTEITNNLGDLLIPNMYISLDKYFYFETSNYKIFPIKLKNKIKNLDYIQFKEFDENDFRYYQIGKDYFSSYYAINLAQENRYNYIKPLEKNSILVKAYENRKKIIKILIALGIILSIATITVAVLTFGITLIPTILFAKIALGIGLAFVVSSFLSAVFLSSIKSKKINNLTENEVQNEKVDEKNIRINLESEEYVPFVNEFPEEEEKKEVDPIPNSYSDNEIEHE